MKWAAAQLKSALNNVSTLPSLILIYGDDGGLVYKLSRETAEAVCPMDDPFMVDKISAGDLRVTPSLLQESAQTLGFGGGRKLIMLDGNHLESSTQNAFTGALKMLLASLEDEGGAVVVVAAAGLEATSAIAKAITAHKKAAAVRCFLDAARDLNTVIHEKLAPSGQKITPEARQFLVESLGKDRGVTESELDKLILYTKNKPEITLEDCLEVIAAAPSVTVFKLCDAIGLRDRAKTDKILQMLTAEGVDANMALAMVNRHLHRLAECHMLCAAGDAPLQAMAKLRPPVFMGKDEFLLQLKRTPQARVVQNINRLYALQAASRKGLMDANLVIQRGLLALSV